MYITKPWQNASAVFCFLFSHLCSKHACSLYIEAVVIAIFIRKKIGKNMTVRKYALLLKDNVFAFFKLFVEKKNAINNHYTKMQIKKNSFNEILNM